MISCDLCGHDKPVFVLDSAGLDGSLVRCPSCGLYYVGSRRSNLTFGSSDSSAVLDRVREANSRFQNLALDEEHRLAILNARWRLQILRRYCAAGRLLEVGCARGDFLRVAREFFAVEGVEPNPELQASAREAAPVYGGVVETLPSTGFDVAASFHVIEHVDSPKAFLTAMAQRVRPGGIIAIETPNIGSLPFRVFGSRWREFIPEHYYFFDSQTIARLMQCAGLQVEKILSVGKYASVDLILNRLSRYNRLFDVGAALMRTIRLSRLTVRINPGDIMLVIARRDTVT